jgi:uncharacterized metal-binding protein YceD (DUF177 family)
MKIKLSELSEGEALEVSGAIDSPQEYFDIPQAGKWAALTYDLIALRTGDECLVRGQMETEVTRECERCLESLPMALDIEFIHSYDCKEIVAIDLTADTREDILLGLPMAFRCQLDENECCPNTGKSYREGPDPFEKLRKNDTWQQLDKLEEKQNGSS